MSEDSQESPAARSIEAFFLNPAFIMESQTPQPIMSKTRKPRYSGAMSAHHKNSFDFEIGHERQISTATIKNVVDEPVFWHGYTSDEEAASPIGVDDMDWDEADDFSFSNLPSLSPGEEQAATIVNQAHQLCTHAQAVTILSAGRPKMVTVPRLTDVPRPERDPRVNSLPNQLREKSVAPHLRSYSLEAPSHERSSSEYSQKDSLDSSGGVSPLSTAPSSIHEQPPRSHRLSVSSKHVPLMEAARHVPLMEAARMGSPVSPNSPSSVGGLKGSYTWSQPAAPTSAPSVPRSSMSIKSGVLSALINRFESSDAGARRSSKSGSSNISRIGKNMLRRDTLEDIEDEYMSRMAEPEPKFTQPASPIIRLPNRSSVKPAKMVARGGDERAPVLTLPSCPDDFSRSFESEWPLFTDPSRITTVA